MNVASVLCARGVKYWLDTERIAPGDNILAKMDEGLNQATVVIAFFGAEGVDGKWQDLEIQAALHMSLSRNKKVIPVLLPGAGHSASLPTFLQGLLHVNLRSVNDSEQLEKLIQAILTTDSDLASSPAAQPDTSNPDDLEEYQDLLESLVYDAKELSVNFLIGPAAWTSTRRLRTQVSGQFADPLVAAGLPDSLKDLQVEIAAIYFALLKRKEDAPARELSSIIGALPPSPDAAATRLAAVLSSLSRRRMPDGPIQLVLTTNQDLAVERALLQAALPFTRMVRDIRRKSLIVEAYRFPEKDGFPTRDGVYTKGGISRSFPRPTSVIDADRLLQEREGREFWYASQPDPRSVGREQVKGLVSSFEFEDRPSLVLYKFKGSIDVRGSCVISADDLYDCAAVEGEALVPRQVTSSILENMAVLLGYYPSDMDMRLLHRTILRDLRRERDKPPKYAISPLPMRSQSIEEDIRETLCDEMQDWLEGQGFRTARQDVAQFLEDLTRHLSRSEEP